MTPDDDTFDPPDAGTDAPSLPSISELVQNNPIGAVIGAFVIGLLVSRLI